MTTAPYARRIWQVLETLHAVTYFAGECRDANRDIGLRGFWRGYVAARSAPLGPVAAPLVTAAFANFAPAMIERAIPDAWHHASPAALVVARAEAAAVALRRLVPDVDEVAARSLPLLSEVIATAAVPGRPLFAANRAVPPPDDPVAALWQAATTLREHRGDGHVACLVAAELRGCAIHVLFAAGEGVPPALLRDNRGWTEADWAAATAELEERGLVAEGALTRAGERLRADIEGRTDHLAGAAYTTLSEDERGELLRLLGPPARAVVASGVIPYPNPMGLPTLA